MAPPRIRSSTPAPFKTDVLVVGGSPALRTVATSLHEQLDLVVREVPEPANIDLAAANAGAVVVADLDASVATMEKLEQLSGGAAQRPSLLTLTPRQALAHAEAPLNAQEVSVDFVRLSQRLEHGEPDREVLAEIALRVKKLWRLARGARTGAPDPDEGVHDWETGRLDAARIARFLDVPLSKLAEVLGHKYTSVHKTPAAASLQEGLGPFARIIELLKKLHDTRAGALAWLHTPHRELDERTPFSVMMDGRAAVVRDMLEAAYLGLPT